MRSGKACRCAICSILLRPFPFQGDHFLNLQWRGGNVGHFICGNVIYARQHSPHLRNLYEMSIDRFFGSSERIFGEVGPMLLSDYVASPAGAELRDGLFSPVFFNPIDWTEVDLFDRPIADLSPCQPVRGGHGEQQSGGEVERRDLQLLGLHFQSLAGRLEDILQEDAPIRLAGGGGGGQARGAVRPWCNARCPGTD